MVPHYSSKFGLLVQLTVKVFFSCTGLFTEKTFFGLKDSNWKIRVYYSI